jgi:perosamine synthetase
MIPVAEPVIGAAELANVTRAVKSGWVSSLGEFIPEFESGFAGYSGAKYGIATCNGTAAVQLALAALGIGPGDEVIVPSLTFVATANAVHYLNARPVFADVRPDYWNLDPALIEALINPRTKAIIAVHLYGHPADMDAINAVAARHHIPVIEDAAEAHGAEYRGRKVGSIGIISCFSFYGNKIITTGEGGMCLTSDAKLTQKMNFLRDHAMSPERRYWHEVIGYNFRMTNLQAALGVAQLTQIDNFIARKIEIAAWYQEGLAELADTGKLTLHPQMSWAKCVYWLYSVLVEDSFGRNTAAVAAGLRENGVDSRPFFHPNHLLPPYAGGPALPVAENIARRGLSLPTGVNLTKPQVQGICDVLKKLALS